MIKNSNDISKIYEKFPDQNPNPVMRSSATGDILYFNDYLPSYHLKEEYT